MRMLLLLLLFASANGLSTNVGGGENQGRSLQHSSVVRELRTLGGVGIEQAEFEASTGLDLRPEWKRENLSLVVFVQENAGRKILAVGRAKFN